LKQLEPAAGLAPKLEQIEAEGLIRTTTQTTQALAGKNRGTAPIALLEMQLSDGQLQDSLQQRPHRPTALMPELLKQIVSAVPGPTIKQSNRVKEAGIDHQRTLT
jgi:hypothetical protein